jgi:hypothetical protein
MQNKQAFQESIYNELITKGYKPVTTANGEPYNAKDIYFCPQAWNLFMITITPGATRLRKLGKGGYERHCATQVKGPQDINQLHNELNKVILESDESSLQKSKGCLGLVLLLLTTVLSSYVYLS